MSLRITLDQSWQKPAAALKSQLESWKLRTSSPDVLRGLWQVMPEQRGQVERLDRTIGLLLQDALERQGADELQTALLRRDGVHAVAMIWEFFRSRLAQRDSFDLRGPLLLADDLAYTCWAPAMAASGAIAREPPLGSFGTSPTPLLWPRDQAFPVPMLPSPWDSHFASAIRALPVPVFELPWSQVRYLPPYVTVAHETGHAVDTDLGVGPTLDAALQGMRGPWPAWRSEMLADLWGLLGCGAGYAAALAGALARPAQSVRVEKIPEAPRVGAHPPARLRMPLLFALADAIGVEVTEVRAAWEALLGTQEPLPLQDELPEVAEVLTRPWPALGDRRPQEVLPPPTRAELQAEMEGSVFGQAIPQDPRKLAAAAAWAWFVQPDAYAEVSDDALLERYNAHRSAGFRGPRGDLEGLGPDTADADRAIVDELRRQLDQHLAALENP